MSQPQPSRAVVVPAGRELPRDEDAEAKLLGTIFMDGQTIVPKTVMAGLRPESFYASVNATLYALILDLYAANKPTTIDVVAAELRKRRELDAIGGFGYLVKISDRVPTTAEAPALIEAVRSYAVRRAIIRSRSHSVEEAYNATGDADQLVAQITSAEAAATATGSDLSEEDVPTVCDALLAELDIPKGQRKGAVGERSWGVSDIDHICGKMAPGSLNVLAACPSGGKSALGQQAAWACCRSGTAAAYFSYEMLKRDVVVRIAQQESRLNYDKFDDAPMDVKLRFTKAIREIKANKHLHVFERDTTINRIVARCRTLHRKAPLGLIVIDFLQYLSRLEPTIGKERTDEKLGRITGSLKQLGKECDCPVLLLSSLNREGYKSGAGRPNLASLRSSGEIESDADVVIFLHWPAENPHTGQAQDPHDGSQGSFFVSVIQDKGRQKGVHEVGVMFDRHATRFDNRMP